MKPPILRTSGAGIAGGIAIGITNFLTFGLLSGSRIGTTGLLFDPASQSPKVIAVWKEIPPLPVITTAPAVILGAWLLLAIAYAFIYRSIASAWPPTRAARALRLAIIIWIGALFFELMGPFNLLHEPLRLQCIEFTFWALSALGEAFVIVALLPRPSAASDPN